MAEPKTKKNADSVEGFLSKVKDKQRKEDCLKVLELMKKATGEKPMMWEPVLLGLAPIIIHMPQERKAIGLSLLFHHEPKI